MGVLEICGVKMTNENLEKDLPFSRRNKQFLLSSINGYPGLMENCTIVFRHYFAASTLRLPFFNMGKAKKRGRGFCGNFFFTVPYAVAMEENLGDCQMQANTSYVHNDAAFDMGEDCTYDIDEDKALNMDDNIDDNRNDITSATCHLKTKNSRYRSARQRRNNSSKRKKQLNHQLHIDAIRRREAREDEHYNGDSKNNHKNS